jgi:hypothetical protein
MVKWWNGGMVEWWNGGMVEWWNGGMVEWWNGGMVEWWNGERVARGSEVANNRTAIPYFPVYDITACAKYILEKAPESPIGMLHSSTHILYIHIMLSNILFYVISKFIVIPQIPRIFTKNGKK